MQNTKSKYFNFILKYCISLILIFSLSFLVNNSEISARSKKSSKKIAKSKKFPEGKIFSEVVIPSTFVPNSIDIIVKVKERFIKEFIKKIYFPVISENDDLDHDEKKDLKFDERPFRLSGLVLTYKPNPYMQLDVFTKWLYKLLNENLQKDIPKIKK
jgi:hypothetical protein